MLAAIVREHSLLLDAVAALGPEASTLPVTSEGWTAKDVLAHLVHWGGMVAFGLGAPMTPPPYLAGVTGRLSGDEWNARAVDFSRDVGIEATLAEMDVVVVALMEAVRSRSDADMLATDLLPWAGDRPLWEKIAGDTFAHWPIHRADIERAAGIRAG